MKKRFIYALLSTSVMALYIAHIFGVSPSKLWLSRHDAVVTTVSSVTDRVPRPNAYAFSGDELAKIFESHGFDLDAVREGLQEVPKVYLSSIPNDYHKTVRAQNRKEMFLQTLLPIVLEVNQNVAELRKEIEIWKVKIEEGTPLTVDEKQKLASLYEDYRVKEKSIGSLLKKVDVIPVSITLAQGILESGWGTSNLARNKNSLFGHTNGSGEMKAFSNLEHTVHSHIKNLNCHSAYKIFRDKRAQLRQNEKSLDPHHLAEGLTPYSERGQAYVADIRKIIKSYELYKFDQHLPNLFGDDGKFAPGKGV